MKGRFSFWFLLAGLMFIWACASTETVSETTRPSPVSSSTPLPTVSAREIGGGSYCSEEAMKYMRKTFEYNDKGDYDTALSYVNKAIAISPQCAKAYLLRGMTHQKKDHCDQAIADFTKAIELGLEKKWLALAYFRRGGSYFYKKHYDKAIADFTKAIELGLEKDDLGKACLARGCSYLHKFTKLSLDLDKLKQITNYYNKAIADLTKAIALAPNNNIKARAYFYRGLGHERYAVIKDLEYLSIWASIQDYHKVQARLDNIKKTKARLYDKAIADFTKAIELGLDKEKKAEAYYERGNCYFLKDRYDEAIADTAKAMELASDKETLKECRSLFTKLIDHYKETKQYSKAIAYYPVYLSKFPHDKSAYNSYCWLYHLNKQEDEAIACYQKAIKEVDDRYAVFYADLGTVYLFGKKDYEKAILNYQKAIALNPKDTYSYKGLTYTYLQTKQYQKAYETISKCVKYDKKDRYAWFSLAETAILTDRYAEAQSALKQVKALLDKEYAKKSKDVSYYISASWWAILSKDYEQAKEFAVKGMGLKGEASRKAPLYLNYADACVCETAFKTAVKYYQKAISLDQDIIMDIKSDLDILAHLCPQERNAFAKWEKELW